MRRAHLGAGSRDGDRLAHLREALGGLARRGVQVVRASSVYETEPVGLPAGPALLNGVVEVAAPLTPEGLLAVCLEVEASLGRRRSRTRGAAAPDPGPRPIDLDLLLCGETVASSAALTVPHPRLHLRRFVLEPLAEIAPGARHPVLGATVAELLARCGDPAWVRPFGPPAAWWPPGAGSPAR